MPVDEIEADRLPATEGSPIHAICESCAEWFPKAEVQFANQYRGDTCCWTDHLRNPDCQSDSRGSFVVAPHEEVHSVWLH